jgi:hypothetical protein
MLTINRLRKGGMIFYLKTGAVAEKTPFFRREADHFSRPG